MENNCKNCKYFQQHYYINVSLHIRETNCGRCINDGVTEKEAKIFFRNKVPCKFWESNGDLNLQSALRLKGRLEDITNRINEIDELIEILTPHE